VVNNSWIEKIRIQCPELPSQRRDRFISQYKIPKYDADVLTESKFIADYYEQVVDIINDPKLVSNWVMGNILHIIKETKNSEEIPIAPVDLAELLNLIDDGTITTKVAKEVFEEMVASGKTASDIVDNRKLYQLTDVAEISDIVTRILKEHHVEIAKYKAGKTNIFKHFVGLVMKETKGRASPHLVNKILQEKLTAF
jgi:aspartyl-tRNA(Asn)/glutamyl-tRNA(Gln) amidotransferase subunit B